MARLIDADAFFDNLDCYSDKNKIQKMLDRQPTAYDVEKVVEEINNSENWCNAEMIYPEVAEQIVRKGGVNG